MSSRHPPRRQSRRVKELTRAQKMKRAWPLLLVIMVVALAVAAIVTAYRSAFVGTHLAGVSTDVEVEGRLGATPVVHLHGRLPFTYPKSTVAIKGDGKTIEDDSDAILQISSFDGMTGTFKGSRPQLIVGKVNSAAMDNDMIQAIKDQREGSRIVVRRPVSVKGGQHMEINVIDILPSQAHGTVQDLPTNAGVVIDNDPQAPTVTDIPGDNPSSSRIMTVIKGEGEQIGSGAVIVAQFGVWNWKTGDRMEYTWGNLGPTPIALEQTYDGLKQSLPDQTIGSRCVVVIPADQAKGDDPVVLIVDILGVIDPTQVKEHE